MHGTFRYAAKQQGGHGEVALAAGLPGVAAHVGPLADVRVGKGADGQVQGLRVAGEPYLHGVAQVHGHDLPQLPADDQPRLGHLQQGVALAQADGGLLLRQDGQQHGAALSLAAQGDALLHDAVHVLSLQAALIALQRAGLPGLEVHPHVVVHGAVVVFADKVGDGFLQAEGADDQRVAADQAHQAEEGAALVAHQVADDHLGVEGAALPDEGDALQQDPHAGLWGLGPEQVGGGFPGGLAVGAQADQHAQDHRQDGDAPAQTGDGRA